MKPSIAFICLGLIAYAFVYFMPEHKPEAPKLLVMERCYDGTTYVEFHQGTQVWITTKLHRITAQPVPCVVK